MLYFVLLFHCFYSSPTSSSPLFLLPMEWNCSPELRALDWGTATVKTFSRCSSVFTGSPGISQNHFWHALFTCQHTLLSLSSFWQPSCCLLAWTAWALSKLPASSWLKHERIHEISLFCFVSSLFMDLGNCVNELNFVNFRISDTEPGSHYLARI